MSNSLARGTLIGYVGSDAELRYTPNGDPVTTFSVAVSRGPADRRETDWFRISAWRQRAEFASKHVVKGTLVYVAARLERRDWTDKDGNRRQDVELIAEDIRLLSRAPGARPAEGEAVGVGAADEAVEELPF